MNTKIDFHEDAKQPLDLRCIDPDRCAETHPLKTGLRSGAKARAFSEVSVVLNASP